MNLIGNHSRTSDYLCASQKEHNESNVFTAYINCMRN